MHLPCSDMDLNPAPELSSERTQTCVASYCGLRLSFGYSLLKTMSLLVKGIDIFKQLCC